MLEGPLFRFLWLCYLIRLYIVLVRSGFPYSGFSWEMPCTVRERNNRHELTCNIVFYLPHSSLLLLLLPQQHSREWKTIVCLSATLLTLFRLKSKAHRSWGALSAQTVLQLRTCKWAPRLSCFSVQAEQSLSTEARGRESGVTTRRVCGAAPWVPTLLLTVAEIVCKQKRKAATRIWRRKGKHRGLAMFYAWRFVLAGYFH